MYRKLTSLRWHTYLPADAGETFTSTLDLFFAGPFLFAKPELAKHKNSRKTLLSSIFREFYIHAVCGRYGMLWGFHFTFLCILNLCLQIETCGDHNSCEACHNDRQYQRQDKVVYVSLSVDQLGCRQHSDDTCAVRQCIQTNGRHCNQSV